MDMCRLYEYLPDQNDIIFWIVVLGFFGINFKTFQAYYPKYKHKRNVREIVRDGVYNILADYPPEDPKTGKREIYGEI